MLLHVPQWRGQDVATCFFQNASSLLGMYNKIDQKLVVQWFKLCLPQSVRPSWVRSFPGMWTINLEQFSRGKQPRVPDVFGGMKHFSFLPHRETKDQPLATPKRPSSPTSSLASRRVPIPSSLAGLHGPMSHVPEVRR